MLCTVSTDFIDSNSNSFSLYVFQRVNEGVLDVVAKLEDVAVAMRAVEQESRDIWGDSDSALASVNS